MCYAIPGKIVNIKDKIVTVDYFGEHRNVLRDFSDISVGDYVYAQGGVLISKIETKEAEKILNFWKEKFFELKETDKELSETKDTNKARDNVLHILQKFNQGKDVQDEELLELLNIKNNEELDLLLSTANNWRQKENGNACCVHGIIEFSNYCKNDCYYCGIRKSQDIERYRMDVDEIIKIAKHAVDEYGFKALVLQSGEDQWYTEEKLIKIVEELRKLNILIFLSIGVRSKETYEKLYKAGARAILLRFETSNKELFKKMRPDTSFEERIRLIKDLKEIGYLIATGFLLGLGESDEDVINNIRLTKSIGADMYSFGPLIPAKGTPLEGEKLISKEKMFKVIAISRLLDKKAKILVTSALETLDKKARREALLAGANSLMINVTPYKYREMYNLYPNRAGQDEKIIENINSTVNLLLSIGRAPTDLGI